MIKINDVSYKYKNSNNVLDNINLQINEGEFIAIIGQNGSGKSTLARLISGITYPTSGDIFVDEINTKDKKTFLELRKKIGVVFQNPENQIVFEKVYDDIAFSLTNLGIDKNEQKEKIENALESVGVKSDKNTYELSLGKKQRVAIASAVAINSPYIVFDEPTTMLDPKGKKKINQIIKTLNNKGITIIYVTNEINEILLADRIVVLGESKVKCEFKCSEIFEYAETLKNLSLEIPTIVDIALKLRKNGIDINLNELTIENLVKEIVGDK